MNCTKDCEEYEKPSVMLQGTSGIRPGGGSDDIQTLLTQKQIKNLPDIHHEEDQITLTMSPNS